MFMLYIHIYAYVTYAHIHIYIVTDNGPPIMQPSIFIKLMIEGYVHSVDNYN